jgi:signal transduction histidine kinase/chemotaxis response regulator CheB
MRFRPSTSLTLALLIGLLASAGQWISHATASDVLEATIRQREIDKVDTVGRVIERLIAQRGQQALQVARLIASHDDVATAVRRHGVDRTASLAGALDEAFQIAHVQSLEVSDADETIVYRAPERQRVGEQAKGWGITEALAGSGMLVSVRERDGLTIRAIEPLRSGSAVVGVISVGVALDTAFFDQLSREVGARLTLLSRRGSQLPGQGASSGSVDIGATTEAFQKKIPIYRIDGQSRQTSVYLPVMIVDEAYVILAQLDSSAAYRLLDAGKRQSAIFAALTLLGSVVIGLLALRLAMGPLRRLRARAEAVAQDLTGASIHVPGRDEIASVVEVLQTLTDRLVERNRELVDASARADAATQAKSQFLSTMSHEIRTPLNGILGMTELLQHSRLDSEQSRFVGAIATAGSTLHDLLSDILDLAKIEQGKVLLDPVDFDLGRLLAEVADVYREVARARGLSLVTALPDSIGRLRGDPTRLRQVLSNLLGNATKFTERGEVRLRAERMPAAADDARAWWRFTVEDTGIGIAPESMTRLFQHFVQADASTTRQFGGTGLGLAICRHLVQLMGGRIDAHSVPGEGARFWLDLPFEAAADQQEPAPPARRELPRTGCTVLVAEDNPINQQVIERMLQHLGAVVTVADDGEAAVALVQRESFDLVFMDCLMPVMDGFEATRRIREWERGQDERCPVPIIALTANALAGDRDACLAAGMTDYLAKPISSTALAKTLSRHARDIVRAAAPTTEPRIGSIVAGSEPSFDPLVLNSLPMVADGSAPAFAGRMLDLFAANAKTLLDAIDTATREDDPAAVLRCMHKLKANAAQVGAAALAAEATRQETCLRTGSASAPDGPARLRRLFGRFERAVEQHRQAADMRVEQGSSA